MNRVAVFEPHSPHVCGRDDDRTLNEVGGWWL